MKVIKINNCGTCLYSDARRLKFGGWEDCCFILNKIVNCNTIDNDCKLDDFKKEI